MDLNMATDSYVQLFVTAFDFKIYICFDSSCPLFFHFLSRVLQSFYSKSGISESEVKQETTLKPCINTNITNQKV